MAVAGAGYIRLVNHATRWTVDGIQNLRQLVSSGDGFIAAFWHGRLFMSPTFAPRGRRTVAMVSRSRDGDLIAAIIRRFGVEAIRGSSLDARKRREKGGAEAYALARRELLDNSSFVAITPDGPRGPLMRAKEGVALLAMQTGCPILPIAFSTVWGRILKSLDRFLLPWPFGRGAIVYGPPLWPERRSFAKVEPFRLRIEQALDEVTARADLLCGRPPLPQVTEQ